jgi:Tfp pilus assembly protein PilF
LVTADKLASNGHYREALLELDRAIEFQPQLSRELAGKLAIMSSQLGDVPRAKSEFERALSQSPNDSNIMNDYGCFLASQGQLADAEMWYRKALIANHANKRAWNNLGLVLAKQGRAEESLSAFQHAVSQPEAFQNLGMALAKAGHTSQALAYLEKAHSLQPDSKPTELALRIVQRMHSEKNAHVSLAGHIEPAAEQLR